MGSTSLNADFENVGDASVLYFLKAYSFYDEELDERYIYAEDFSCRRIASLTKGTSKDKAARALQKIKKKGYIEHAGWDRWIVNPCKKNYVMVETEFVKELLKLVKSDALKVYVYLLRKYRWAKESGNDKAYFFTNREIVEKVLCRDYGSGAARDKATRAVDELKEAGLIDYDLVKIPRKNIRVGEFDRLYTRRLKSIREK